MILLDNKQVASVNDLFETRVLTRVLTRKEHPWGYEGNPTKYSFMELYLDKELNQRIGGRPFYEKVFATLMRRGEKYEFSRHLIEYRVNENYRIVVKPNHKSKLVKLELRLAEGDKICYGFSSAAYLNVNLDNFLRHCKDLMDKIDSTQTLFVGRR